MFLYLFVMYFLTQTCLSLDKPRGVPFSKLSFYKPNSAFKCIDGSGTIDWWKVNDDYCDCRDGSDEPGTSACHNGVFYCENKGYRPLYVLSSRVNDGVCDCCDGEDEYSGVINCTNICWELGHQAREELERLKKAAEIGHEIYNKYVQNYESSISEKKSRLETINKELEKLNEEKLVSERNKNDAEATESNAKTYFDELNANIQVNNTENSVDDNKSALKAFNELDIDKNEVVTYEELQSHAEFDIDQNGDVSKEEAREYLNEHDSVTFHDFEEFVWPSIKEVFKFKSIHNDVEPGDIPEEEKTEDEKGDKATATTEAPLTKPVEYDEKTKELIEAATKARNAHQELLDKISNLDEEKRKLDELLNTDFGPRHSFYELAKEDNCYELEDREYVYRLCPFRKTVQGSRGGGSETELGRWGHWQGDDYREQLYDHGTACWNGPNRSTKVLIRCGPENKLISASEPSRCEYQFQFETPAACDKPASEIQDMDEVEDQSFRDEL